MSIFIEHSNNIKDFNIMAEKADNSLCFVAKSEEIPLGLLEAKLEEGEYNITNIYVKPQYRRHMIGSRLLKCFINYVESEGSAPINIMYTLKNDNDSINALIESWPKFEIVTVGYVFSEKLNELLENKLIKKLIQHAGDLSHMKPVRELGQEELMALIDKLNEYELTEYDSPQDLLNNVDGTLSAVKEKDGEIIGAILVCVDERGIHIDNVFSDKVDMLGFGELISYSLTRDITKYGEKTVYAVATNNRVKKISQELFGKSGDELKLAFGR